MSNLDQQFAILAQCNRNFIQLLDAMSNEQLNEIPEGYRNNLVWNYTHAFVAIQGLCYALAGVAPTLHPAFIQLYKKGTFPDGQVSADEWNAIKISITKSCEQLKIDYETNKFQQYNSYTTSFQFTLNTIEEAIVFATFHTGLHFGYALAQRKLLLNKQTVQAT